jgi:hypothetical protein
MIKVNEESAEFAHWMWSKWMIWMFENGGEIKDGIWTMKKEKYERWQKQMNTSYKDLSEEEKQSDRDVVQEWLDSK